MQVLFHAQGLARPGQFMALMGPSGSGKTTLVSVIGGRTAASMRVEGDILFNGRPLSRRIKRDVGFVLQDDLLFDSLTVHETLLYAARLRLPRTMSMCFPIHSLRLSCSQSQALAVHVSVLYFVLLWCFPADRRPFCHSLAGQQSEGSPAGEGTQRPLTAALYLQG